MFYRHEAEIPTIRQLKIIEEVNKLVDEMKNLHKCKFNRTNSRKANKTIENFKENSLSPNCPISCEGCRNNSSRLSYTTLHSFPSSPSFCLGEVPNNYTQDPQCHIDSSTVVLGRSIVFFSFSLTSKACSEVFPTLLKFLGPADPKNPGQRPLTQNFWVIVKFWVAVNFGSKNLGQSKILGQRFWVIAKIWVNEKFWVNVFGSLQKFGSAKNFGSKLLGHCRNLGQQKILGQRKILGQSFESLQKFG